MWADLVLSGISLPEDGKVTPYDNPLVSNFHVPLVFVRIALSYPNE